MWDGVRGWEGEGEDGSVGWGERVGVRVRMGVWEG